MVRNERELAKAIQHRESVIDLHNDLIGGVEKIKDPSAIAWASVAAALASSAGRSYWKPKSVTLPGRIIPIWPKNSARKRKGFSSGHWKDCGG